MEGGLNTYTYALNNPLYWIDPTGEAVCGGVCVGMGLGIGGRALFSYFTRSAAVGTAAWAMSNSGDTPHDDATDDADPKQCDDKDNDCDLEFVRETPSYDGKTKTCWYKRKGVMFTFPQAVGYPCPPIDRERCMVDTSYIRPPARY